MANYDGERSPRADKAKLAAFHEEARAEFSRITEVNLPERMEALKDRRFVRIRGAQWEGVLGEQFANRPMYEINKTALAIDQIVTDYEENQIDASFTSGLGVTDKALADACAARYRADMRDCNAAKAFRNGFSEGVAGGIGAWRFATTYEDKYSADPDDPQRIIVKTIHDADRFVFWDLDARESDKSDARRCYVLCPMTHAEFERRYPDRGSPADWPNDVHQGEFDWATDDTVYVCEVYDAAWEKDVEVSYTPPTAMQSVYTPGEYQTAPTDTKPGRVKILWQSEIDEDPEIETDLLDMGYRKTGERKRKRKAIQKYLMDGMGVIEGPDKIPGCEIPIIMFYAHHYVIDNVERSHGHVRLARDAQQIKNMSVSKLAEFVAVASPEKPYMTPEQSAGFKDVYAKDNIVNNPYLPINPVTTPEGKQPMGPVGWTKNSNVPPALTSLQQQTDVDIKEILSTPSDPAGKVVSHTSGSVVKAAQKQVDAKSATYISNLGEAIRWGAKVYLGMMPDVYYQPGRKLKGLGPRGEETMIELHQDSLDDEGNLETLNDMSRANFDVTITIGPSSESEEEAAVELGVSLLGVTEDPQLKRVINLTIMANMGRPGNRGTQKWARQQLLEMGIGEPTADEQKALQAKAQQAEPTPIDQLALAQAKEAEAKAGNSDANRALTLARVEKTHADTQKVLADAHLESQQAGVDAAKTLHDMKVAEAQAQAEAQAAASQSTPGQSGA